MRAALRRLQRVALQVPLSFVVSAALAGLAGGLFAMAQQSAYPDVMSLHYSGFVVMMVLVGGGLVSFWGPVIGAVVFFLARDVLGALHRDLAALVRPAVHGDRAVQAGRHRRHVAGRCRRERKAAPRRAPQPHNRRRGERWRCSKPASCTSASATASCWRTSSLAFEAGRLSRHHGPERRRQDHLLQRADRPLQARPRPRAASTARDITGLSPQRDRPPAASRARSSS